MFSALKETKAHASHERQSSAQSASEVTLLFSASHEPLDRVSLVVWHGEADGVVPLSELERRLAELGIAPDEMRVFPGEGHCFLNRHHEEIFERLLIA